MPDSSIAVRAMLILNPALRDPCPLPWTQNRHGLPVQGEPVMVIVFVSPALYAQAIELVLDHAPEHGIEGSQRIDFHGGEGVPALGPLDVLEPLHDGVHRLHQHPFFVPVGPDQFQHAGMGQLVL